MPFLKLLLVRHGQSIGNVEGRMEGCQPGKLTPLGHQQSMQLGQRLASEGWHPTHIYCSPLRRAQATLEAMLTGFAARIDEIAGNGGSSHHTDSPLPTVRFVDGLKENSHGIFEGLTWAEAQTRYADLCHILMTSMDWQPIPQAESPRAGRQRAATFVEQLLAQHRNGQQVLVISHYWILQHILAVLMGCDRTWGIPAANAAIFELWLDCDRWFSTDENRFNSELWQLKRFNDHHPCQSTDPD
jgi:probable phosphoglycerate mutase